MSYYFLGFGVLAGVVRVFLAHGAGWLIGQASNRLGGRGLWSGYLCGSLFLLSLFGAKVYVFTVLNAYPADPMEFAWAFLRFFVRTVTLLDLLHIVLGLAVAYNTGAAQEIDYEFIEEYRRDWRFWRRWTRRR